MYVGLSSVIMNQRMLNPNRTTALLDTSHTCVSGMGSLKVLYYTCRPVHVRLYSSYYTCTAAIKIDDLARGTEVLFVATSDCLPSHPTDKWKSHRRSCFDLIVPRQCGILMVLAG